MVGKIQSGVGVQGLEVSREGWRIEAQGVRQCSSCGSGRPSLRAARRASAARGVTFLGPQDTSGESSRVPGTTSGVARDGTRVASSHQGRGGPGPQQRRQRAAPRQPLPSQREPVAREGVGGRRGRGTLVLALHAAASHLRHAPRTPLPGPGLGETHTHTHTHLSEQPVPGHGRPSAACAASGSGGAAPRRGGAGQHGGAQGWAGRPRLSAPPPQLGSQRPRVHLTLARRPPSARGRSAGALPGTGPAPRQRGTALQAREPQLRRTPAGTAPRPEPWNRRRSST